MKICFSAKFLLSSVLFSLHLSLCLMLPLLKYNLKRKLRHRLTLKLQLKTLMMLLSFLMYILKRQRGLKLQKKQKVLIDRKHMSFAYLHGLKLICFLLLHFFVIILKLCYWSIFHNKSNCIFILPMWIAINILIRSTVHFSKGIYLRTDVANISLHNDINKLLIYF